MKSFLSNVFQFLLHEWRKIVENSSRAIKALNAMKEIKAIKGGQHE